MSTIAATPESGIKKTFFTAQTTAWMWLVSVIATENAATSSLRLFETSEGMTKAIIFGGLLVLYTICYYSLSKAVERIPVGIAYATWTGTGILVVSGIAFFLYGQVPSIPEAICMAMISAGIVLLNAFSKMGVEEE